MEANNWISVEDILPDDDKLKVIRYCEVRNGVNVRHLGIALARFYLPSNQKDKKYWSFEFGNAQSVKVTDWLSLPVYTGEVSRLK